MLLLLLCIYRFILNLNPNFFDGNPDRSRASRPSLGIKSPLRSAGSSNCALQRFPAWSITEHEIQHMMVFSLGQHRRNEITLRPFFATSMSPIMQQPQDESKVTRSQGRLFT